MATAHHAPRPMSREEKKLIFASSLGTVFEWYDFYLYGALAAIIAKKFFSSLDETSAFIFALLAFAAGFIVRPFGALVFGRLGDMVGRKYTFLVTILIMGLSTFIVGCLPTYESVGVAAPVALIALRLLQGLALGGEYGGAATYVAEHSPQGKRGAYTAWIQTTATLGLFLSLVMILVIRSVLGEEAFADWGWRIPFLVSILLLGVSLWIRLSMNESPAFQKMKAEGKTSKAPLTESFGQWKNLRIVILALLGLTAGQAAVWYSGQFYAQIFLTQALKVDLSTANILVALSLLIGTPFFIVFGTLSDRIGRKPIILLGCLLAALTYFPVFGALTRAANPALAEAQAKNRVLVTADSAECSFQFNPTGTAKFTSSCDIAKQVLAGASVSYENAPGAVGAPATIRIGEIVITAYSSQGLPADEAKKKDAEFKKAVTEALKTAGYPNKADPERINKVLVVALLTYLVLLVTMVYGPIAAMLVELFPTRIRYTSMSLPYHIGNGWFGGMLPPMAVAIVAQTGNMYNGLWYPIIIAGATVVIGGLFVKETKDVDIYAGD
ncbi:MFS transporter [Verminephrobacter aporrectodeae]|uniref:MFS transporter n=1 Tax=Verminephrobacter aporrectodeae subsp. tuberculatae TaxID=1110392 RepID=A0ABT3KT46_9BURK|nr:MFS transporter [Verminephrobacter aporrectodeae]MCW5222476.1 MFS transporter [Verminephrobacter aporrectodeae subsp. tuberculatae]MCW5287941.1 MFS transporter [Verminephrobacter aporrectodeae subsp. tuberculatae]MCW5321498.1 MFS transporter [Verminephrobacter aporrectodeae subsp. tuberculatae]MCW8174100.1 MFS transporter [Verminephrobacter aporrectodeae subsp. tuberculatae]MCW8197948.1 MFS transporter [Verminephrobacter aporrectodeae subsp. tuberculatae]